MIALCAASFIACGGMPAEEPLHQSHSEIIDGERDTEHDAVVALSPVGCTGTIIAVAHEDAYVLTAAHCMALGEIEEVLVGEDRSAPIAALAVVDTIPHPGYTIDPENTASVTSFDFAILRVTGASADTPAIPALAPDEDTLARGDVVEHVGYGVTEPPSEGMTGKLSTVRHHAPARLDDVDGASFWYSLASGGPCAGDSGGPSVIDTGEGERVAGVIAAGDPGCTRRGRSGRVSAISSWLAEVVSGTSNDESAAAHCSCRAGSSDANSIANGAWWFVLLLTRRRRTRFSNNRSATGRR